MKNTILLLTASALAALLCGCAGYNHTLFMTKSNVGLDFDSKPPTLEISVSRKEAVIAPSFEGGQTPPVMASFKPHAGTGNGFANFFLGVDQTFAGGDAAMAMAMLYDKPTATDPTPYDSALPLSKKPDYNDWFRKIPGQGVTRPFIFGTDTSFGFKAAWTGTGGQIPDTVRLGFNRKEFAWAPLTATRTRKPDGSPDGAKVTVKMPAFLATIESRQELSMNGGARVQGLQYFATGKAATHLAMQNEVRKAMHARLDPNAQAFKSKFAAQGHDVIPDILFSTDRVLTRYAQRGDARAIDLLARLNNLPSLGLPAHYRNDSIPIYVFDPADSVLKKNHGGPLALGNTLSDATAYLSWLELSQHHLTNALGRVAQNQVVNLQAGSAAAPKTAITPAMVTELVAQRADLKRRADELVAALASSPDVEAAYDYTQRKLNP